MNPPDLVAGWVPPYMDGIHVFADDLAVVLCALPFLIFRKQGPGLN